MEGAGGAPSVFDTVSNQADRNTFDVSLPIADEMVPFVHWIASLPASERPKTAAYPMAQDPFADPPVELAQTLLQNLNIKTVYSNTFTEIQSAYTAPAQAVAASGAQLVVLGSTDVPTVQTFMQVFQQQHYTPKLFIAASGPDQGSAFVSAVGQGNENGMMVPDGWYPGYVNAASQQMVKEYLALYGGTASGINADVAEAYSVGQIMAQAIIATHSTDNAKIIAYLHSGVTLTTVQGPVRFDALGENGAAAAFVFQWQQGKFIQVLPSHGNSTVIDKTAWTNASTMSPTSLAGLTVTGERGSGHQAWLDFHYLIICRIFRPPVPLQLRHPTLVQREALVLSGVQLRRSRNISDGEPQGGERGTARR